MESSAASNQSLQETDNYLFLDPRGSRGATGLGLSGVDGMGLGDAAGSGISGTGRTCRMVFSEGMVFVVGGARYVEYENLEEWAKKAGKQVTYGGTGIIDPGGFVGILAKTGKTR
jgi:sec1 family domain-containing protein 1